jgi:WhiB family transcriptional regulator, redox-sensing transcriptional regulator
MSILVRQSHVRAPGMRTDEDPSWRLGAACSQANADWFFATGDSRLALDQIAAAKNICSTCPVLQTCRDWSLTPVNGNLRDQFGVFAAMTPAERRTQLRLGIPRTRASRARGRQANSASTRVITWTS